MFKWLLTSSLSNRLLVLIASVVLMAYGAWTLSRTPVDVFPDLNKPTVTIMTEAGGMAAEEVEQLITFPLETTMNGLPGVETVRSVSSAGLSFLYVTFGWDTEIFRARQMVSERLASMEEGLRRGRRAADGAHQLHHGRDHADRDPGRHREDLADGGARVCGLGTSAASDGDSWRRAGDSRSAARCGSSRCSRTRPAWRNWASRTSNWKPRSRAIHRNTSGGFLELNGREYLIRHLGRTSLLDDLKSLALAPATGRPSCCARSRTSPSLPRPSAVTRASKASLPSSSASRSSPRRTPSR